MRVHRAATVDQAELELPQRRVNGVLHRPPSGVGHHVYRLRRLLHILPVASAVAARRKRLGLTAETILAINNNLEGRIRQRTL